MPDEALVSNVVPETPPVPPPEPISNHRKPPSQSLLQLVQSHDKDPPLVPEPESEPIPSVDDVDSDESVKVEKETTADVAADPPADLEHKALRDLKALVREALETHQLITTLTSPNPKDLNPIKPEAETEQPMKPETETEQPIEPETETEGPTKQEPENEIDCPGTDPEVEKVTPLTVTVDEDGAKTVEAIQETIVAVSASDASPKIEQDQETEQEQSKLSSPASPAGDETTKTEEVTIYGIPLMADERTDTILLKFLRARDFKVKEAFTMLKNTLRWRREFGIDQLVVSDDDDEDLNKAVFMHGSDKEGHPVCYNVYGEFQSKELYHKTFSDEDKRNKFLRWRIQFLENSVRKLDFSPGGSGPCTIVQVNDLKNSPGPAKWELRQATKQALQLLQDNYPEFVAKQVFINVPWWYLAVNRMVSPFLTQRTKSKFVFAGPSKSAETLFRYIAAEQVPLNYGGLSKIGDFDPSDAAAVTEINLKPAAKHTVEFPVTHEGCVVTWEVRVVGWEVRYGAEFVPSGEGSYTVIIQKCRKFGPNAAPVVCESFKAGEPGKVVVTIDNTTSKKKKLLYRLKAKPCSE